MDELTGLSNRRGFVKLAQQALRTYCRHDVTATMVFLDLNRFKLINDTHGHSEGDRALQLFADVLREVSRGADVVGRLGGDEFVALLGEPGYAGAKALVDRTRGRLSAACLDSGLEYDLHFSAGVLQVEPDATHGVEELLSEADRLMYADKLRRA